jgi:hypothetical protein
VSSIRLHHPTLRNTNYAVELPGKLNQVPIDCNKCNRGRPEGAERIVHVNKVLHLDLDASGDCFIHPDILPLLQTVPTMAGLEVSNATENAPSVRVGAVEAPQQETVLADGRRFYIPARTKWEADRITTDFWKREVLTPLAEVYDRKATAERAEKRTIFKLEGRR